MVKYTPNALSLFPEIRQGRLAEDSDVKGLLPHCLVADYSKLHPNCYALVRNSRYRQIGLHKPHSPAQIAELHLFLERLEQTDPALRIMELTAKMDEIRALRDVRKITFSSRTLSCRILIVADLVCLEMPILAMRKEISRKRRSIQARCACPPVCSDRLSVKMV